MTFLYPLMLGLGILVAVPFIIHLMGERKYHPLAFPSLKFLREIERESLQRLHLRQWLILISRALWIAMLVLALAMPFFHSASGNIETGVLVVDKSFSTQADPDFVGFENEMMEEYHRWAFVSYNERSNIDSMERTMNDLLKGKNKDEVNILFLTDLQGNEQNLKVINMLSSFSKRTHIIPKLKKNSNYAVSDLKSLNYYDRDMHGLRVQCSFSDSSNDESTIYVSVNGKPVGQMKTDENGRALYFFSKPKEVESLCVVRSLEDDYPDDNVRYLVLNNVNKINILCINDPKDGFYHLNALKAMEAVELTEILPEELSAYDLDNYDLLWFSALYDINAAGIERLIKYSDTGVLLLTASSIQGEDNPWQRLIRDISPPSALEGYLGVTSNNGQTIRDMRISQYYESKTIGKNLLWKTSDGSPLLFESATNVFQLMSPFHFDWNEMGLSPYFTHELSRALNEMLDRKTRPYYCGDMIELSESFSNVTTPTGEKHTSRNIFDNTRVPGFYRIDNNDKIKTIAVNIYPDECMQDILDTRGLHVIDWDEQNIDEIDQQIKGRNSQSMFFIFALLFIIFEMLLLRKGEKTK